MDYEKRKERWDAYQICKQRGHTPSGVVTASNPPMHSCKFCGSYFWTEIVKKEMMIPKNPDEH